MRGGLSTSKALEAMDAVRDAWEKGGKKALTQSDIQEITDIDPTLIRNAMREAFPEVEISIGVRGPNYAPRHVYIACAKAVRDAAVIDKAFIDTWTAKGVARQTLLRFAREHGKPVPCKRVKREQVSLESVVMALKARIERLETSLGVATC